VETYAKGGDLAALPHCSAGWASVGAWPGTRSASRWVSCHVTGPAVGGPPGRGGGRGS